MTDNGQGLALKGADEVGDAPEDNTMVAIQEGRARASASELENAETGVQQSPAQRLAVAASSLMQRATGTTPKAEGGKARATPATKPIEGATSNEEVMVQLRAMQEQLRAETEKSAALEKKLAHAEREAEQKRVKVCKLYTWSPAEQKCVSGHVWTAALSRSSFELFGCLQLQVSCCPWALQLCRPCPRR